MEIHMRCLHDLLMSPLALFRIPKLVPPRSVSIGFCGGELLVPSNNHSVRVSTHEVPSHDMDIPYHLFTVSEDTDLDPIGVGYNQEEGHRPSGEKRSEQDAAAGDPKAGAHVVTCGAKREGELGAPDAYPPGGISGCAQGVGVYGMPQDCGL